MPRELRVLARRRLTRAPSFLKPTPQTRATSGYVAPLIHVRRRFDYLIIELSVELGELAPRYAIWLSFQEAGIDPELLSKEALLAFYDGPLPELLAKHGMELPPRRGRRLRRRLERFDPRYPTPEETMMRLFAPRP